ncbi:serine hydrolase domain-containing protein [Streptosporangium sp. NBC_01469]|uniref:serine hydrolase domain-containing protein n=1 Tax=Streptosporangium sp. NBC_01469 TaxID=2903898 RepID=UPI002E2B0A1F|nr:serine hydrolase domain-containing protein [Streptosporangium sp. NBC_01469]
MFKPTSSRSRLLACGLATMIAVGAVAAPATASATATPAGTAAATDSAPLQKALDDLVKKDNFPGALATVHDSDGKAHYYTAGVGNLKTRSKVPADGRVRIASNTKMYTATVVLQLVGEGKVELDAPIERYLPKLVRGKAGDGRKITVRQILQHTSGLPDYDEALFADFADFAGFLRKYWKPQEILDLALKQKALFKPGKGWSYSNTNYVLAGMLVEKVTGRPIGQEITDRIIKRIGLRDTYWPKAREKGIRGPHPRGYFATKPSEPWVDVTTFDPSSAWAAGQLIGTPGDLNRFLLALLNGELLEPAQLAEMKRTVAAPDADTVGGSRYGLGLATFKLSCGGFAWTHGGNAPGYTTRNAVTKDGKAAAVAITALPITMEGAKNVEKALDTALCE